MIRHVVFVKFVKDAPQEKIDRFLLEVKKLSHLNKEVRDYSHGMCVKGPRFHSGDFDFANCCDIDTYEAMERYMSHWSHVRMTPFLEGLIDNIMSFDWEIDYYGPPFDPQAAAEEAGKHAARVLPRHDDAARAYVPELRGTSLANARDMLASVGLEMDGDVDYLQGSCWAPDRIMFVEPAVGTDVAKGTKVRVRTTDNWLMGPRMPDAQAAW